MFREEILNIIFNRKVNSIRFGEGSEYKANIGLLFVDLLLSLYLNAGFLHMEKNTHACSQIWIMLLENSPRL